MSAANPMPAESRSMRADHLGARRLRRVAGLLLAFLVAANLPYALLIRDFGYDDILREPAVVVLERFNAGGPRLIAEWLAFALAAALFALPAWLLPQSLDPANRGETMPGGTLTAWLGGVSALLQTIGLLRWSFVVPMLAHSWAQSGGGATGPAILLAFETQHQVLGVLVGELAGQLTLAGWIAGIAWRLWDHGRVGRALSLFGAMTLPLWLLGWSELLATAIVGFPVVATTPLAFMAFEAWLAAIALWCLRQARIPGQEGSP